MKRRHFITQLGLATAAFSLSNVQAENKKNQVDEGSDKTKQLAQRDHDARLDKPVTAIVIGAGGRGRTYANYAKRYPGSLNIVGVSDINDVRRERMANGFNVAKENRLGDWSDVFKRERFADAVIISTPDNLHYEPCLKALDMGYHVLLEKPVAQTEQQCIDILNKSRETGKIVVVCHVLRYAPYFIALRRLVQSGEIGKVLSIQHLEPIGATHMSHSYVRGNWHNSKETTPIILAKSCHDLDILSWILGKKCKDVSAFGSVSLFNKDNAPANSAERCLDCQVEGECSFSARRLYYERRRYLHAFDLSGDKEEQGRQILDRLRNTNYGRCVYRMDNDQCDHYVMNMKFEDGATVAFSMEGLTSYEGRFTRIMGSKGDIVGDMRTFTHTDFLTGKKTTWQSNSYDGHGGGDMYMVRDFVTAIANGDEGILSSTIKESIESHVMGFCAEKSRMLNQVVQMPENL